MTQAPKSKPQQTRQTRQKWHDVLNGGRRYCLLDANGQIVTKARQRSSLENLIRNRKDLTIVDAEEQLNELLGVA
ncbi:hypothetical protein KYT24_004395 [Salmonella enterica]|nr:hypothetical protein [Salmonella enterica]